MNNPLYLMELLSNPEKLKGVASPIIDPLIQALNNHTAAMDRHTEALNKSTKEPNA